MFAITVAGNVAAFTAEGTTIVVRRNRATKSIRVSLWDGDGRERSGDPRNRIFASDAAGARAAREYVTQIADESVTASKKWW